jgi:hypothetical protein
VLAGVGRCVDSRRFSRNGDATRITVTASRDLGPSIERFNEFGSLSVEGANVGTVVVRSPALPAFEAAPPEPVANYFVIIGDAKLDRVVERIAFDRVSVRRMRPGSTSQTCETKAAGSCTR